MGKIAKNIQKFRYKGILAITAVFAFIAAILFIQLSGIQVNYIEKELSLLPQERIVTKASACAALEKNTLFLWDSSEENSAYAYSQFSVMLNDMKIGHDIADLAAQPLPPFANYTTVIVALSDLSPLGNAVSTLCEWVNGGGKAWFPLVLEKNAHSSVVETKLGILDSSYQFGVVHSIYLYPGFMVGGGKAFTIPDAFASARVLQLAKEHVSVYASNATENGIPLVWKTQYGNGTFVVNNIGIYDKAFRGFYAASYSLLDEVCVYPVINGSTFYLDDFPSQIPEGHNTYISRDYNTTVRDFYINIWWPDMMNLADKYGMKFTGLTIECYDDAVDGTTDAKPDTGNFLNFGNMLLRKGGELGYHGYNHQPLCFDNCDYKGLFEYKTWESEEAMKRAFDHLVSFCETLFPDITFSTYVPPSNLLSKEGRAFLIEKYPQIRTISGIYFEDASLDFSCTQEFDVDENGIVDQPRISSSCIVDDFMSLSAVSELNLHFVNNHFTHPDDALDPERGATLGWEHLEHSFDNYLSWLYSSAPTLRNFTGSEMSAAVQRYVAVAPHTEITDTGMQITIGNFYENAQFLVRFNAHAPKTVEGGNLTHLTGSLYVLEATQDTVTISFQ